MQGVVFLQKTVSINSWQQEKHKVRGLGAKSYVLPLSQTFKPKKVSQTMMGPKNRTLWAEAPSDVAKTLASEFDWTFINRELGEEYKNSQQTAVRSKSNPRNVPSGEGYGKKGSRRVKLMR